MAECLLHQSHLKYVTWWISVLTDILWYSWNTALEKICLSS